MFLFLPVDGPPTMVHEHPSGEALSDALGGSVPVGVYLMKVPLAVQMREDCVTAGLARNRTAGMLASSLSGMLIPIVGPACVTASEPVMGSGDGVTAIGAVSCLADGAATALQSMAYDLWLALTSQDHLITRGNILVTSAEWAVAVRRGADQLDAKALPPGYPYPDRPRDRIADGLARHGINVRRGPYSDLI